MLALIDNHVVKETNKKFLSTNDKIFEISQNEWESCL